MLTLNACGMTTRMIAVVVVVVWSDIERASWVAQLRARPVEARRRKTTLSRSPPPLRRAFAIPGQRNCLKKDLLHMLAGYLLWEDEDRWPIDRDHVMTITYTWTDDTSRDLLPPSSRETRTYNWINSTSRCTWVKRAHWNLSNDDEDLWKQDCIPREGT